MTSLKYKLYNNDHNNIDHQIDVACFIYNHCIALNKRFYRRYKKSMSFNKLKAHLAKIKHRKRFSFFGELNSQTIQDIVERIEKGFKTFFKKTIKRPPTFKGKKFYNSITFKQTGYKYKGENKIVIMGKTFSFFKSRPVEGKIKTVTLKRDSLGDHYICFVTDLVKKKSKPATRSGCGFDFGLKTFLTTSGGEFIESPQFLKRSLKKLKKKEKSYPVKLKDQRAGFEQNLRLLEFTVKFQINDWISYLN
jgi:putative transposase